MSLDSEILAIDLFLASRNAPPVHVPGNFETDSHSYISYLKAMNKLQNNGVPYTDAEEQEWLNDLKANENSATSEITESFDDNEMLAIESLEDEDEMIPEIIMNVVYSADLLISPPRVLQCDNFVVSSKENVLENSEDEEEESGGYVFTTDRERVIATSVMKSDIKSSAIEKAEDLDNILPAAELQDEDSELLLRQLLAATQSGNDINHNTNSGNQHNNIIDSDSDDDMFSSQTTTRVAANHFRHRYLSSGNGVDTTSATVPDVGTDDIEDIVISDTDSDVEGDDKCDSDSKHSTTQNINGAHIHANNHFVNSNATQSNNGVDNSLNNSIDISYILSELNGQFTDDYIKHKLSTHTGSNSDTRYLQPSVPGAANSTSGNAHVGAIHTRFYEDVMPFDDGESLD